MREESCVPWLGRTLCGHEAGDQSRRGQWSGCCLQGPGNVPLHTYCATAEHMGHDTAQTSCMLALSYRHAYQ